MIELSERDVIPWKAATGQQMTWTVNETATAGRYNISIQLHNRTGVRLQQGAEHFTFSVQDSKSRQNLFCLTSMTDPTRQGLLRSMFYGAHASAKRKTAGLLNQLIDQLGE